MLAILLALQLGTTPTISERADQALVIGSISASSIALGLTMACTSAGDCHELNPVMAKFLGDGPVRATVFKSTAVGLTAYGIWRTTHGKTRTLLLAVMCAVNTFDAVHDIRQMRKLERGW